ncbi:hypothetical protein [Nitrosomonas communis]|uniref:hypothetical protein n=1 Tax=Nitrosomonas communis TaxID=44574 RepID=UPI0026F2FD55|nr:hypothetical protein [Nitrosomonas communis]
MTYPSSFRCKVLSVRKKEGLTITQAAAHFCVGIASVTRWVKNPNPKQTRNKPVTKIDMIALALMCRRSRTPIKPNGLVDQV